MWINLRPIHTGEQLKFYVCYLPPANSTRNVNSQEYFDLLMSQVYEYQHNSLITIFCDFNVRIGENEDFIAGVDNLPPRNVIDFQTNQYCDGFLDFLVSINMCVFNGRNFKQNDFTSISV